MSDLYIAGAAFLLFSSFVSIFCFSHALISVLFLILSHWFSNARNFLILYYGSGYKSMIFIQLFLSASVLVALIYALPMLYRVSEFVQGVS